MEKSLKLSGSSTTENFVLRSKCNMDIKAWLYNTFMSYSVLAPKSNVTISCKENDIFKCKLLSLDDTNTDNIKYYIVVSNNKYVIEISSNDFYIIDKETFELIQYCYEVGSKKRQRDKDIYIGLINVYVDKEDILDKFTDKNLAKII